MTRYALSVSEIEVQRYRLMAETARELEATHGNWQECQVIEIMTAESKPPDGGP